MGGKHTSRTRTERILEVMNRLMLMKRTTLSESDGIKRSIATRHPVNHVECDLLGVRKPWMWPCRCRIAMGMSVTRPGDRRESKILQLQLQLQVSSLFVDHSCTNSNSLHAPQRCSREASESLHMVWATERHHWLVWAR